MSEIVIKVPEWLSIILAVIAAIYSLEVLWKAIKQVREAWAEQDKK